jgi:hypothetical protein
MPSAWELVESARHLMAVIEDDGGVLTEETEAALAAWVNASEDKIGACVHAARRLTAEADLLKKEEERLYSRRKALEAGEARVREYATMMLLELEGVGQEPKVKTPTYTVWLGESESLHVPDDPALWPKAWTKTVVTVDKRVANAALEAGADVPPGFEVVRKRTVRFR